MTRTKLRIESKGDRKNERERQKKYKNESILEIQKRNKNSGSGITALFSQRSACNKHFLLTHSPFPLFSFPSSLPRWLSWERGEGRNSHRWGGGWGWKQPQGGGKGEVRANVEGRGEEGTAEGEQGGGRRKEQPQVRKGTESRSSSYHGSLAFLISS